MGTGDPTTAPDTPVDVFVSYTGTDEAWAVWVAAVLEAAGRTVAIKAWDAPAGTNLASWISQQMTRAARTVAICSPAYFASHWRTQEWTGALAGSTLIPLRVDDCAIPPVLATIVAHDLHGIDEPTARRRLLEAFGLATPARVSTGFPGRPTPAGAMFPGAPTAGARPGRHATPQPPTARRPPGAVRVSDADPHRLGVHRAIHLPGASDDTPPAYVARDIDHSPTGIRARLRAAAARGGFVLLVGGSSAGKTRCAVEALKAELSDWWLLRPTSAVQITHLAAAPPARIVLWLDEIQTYLDGAHGLTATTVSALLDAPTPVVLVGTMWPERYRAFTTPPPPGTSEDPYRWERETLRHATVVDVDSQLTPTEEHRARHIATRDPRVQAALGNPDDGLTQTLAAAPALLRHWGSAKDDEPYAWAVITAALDATRLGVRTPLTADLLRAAAPDYCTPRHQALAPSHWFDRALIYATTPLHGATAVLNPVPAAMGRLAGYTVADYLLHHATRTRRHERIPAALWNALRDHLTHSDDLSAVINTALKRRIHALAVPLLRRQADAGDQDAARRLAALLAEAGKRDELRARADTGDQDAARRLAALLAEAGKRDELRARADTGRRDAARQLAELLARTGQRDELRARADTGDWYAAGQLAELLAETGQHDELRTRADTGDRDASRRLARLLAETGQRDELRTRADTGDRDASRRLARLLAEAGVHDGLRARADAGDWYASRRLARLLAETGQHDELRTRADTGDEHAADRLTRLLARAGQRDELRIRADAGDQDAARRLAELLAETGQQDELRTRADTGDQDAVDRLARLLAETGQHDELRTRADTSDWYTVDRLARLLAETGQHDELRTRADTGDRVAAYRLARLLAETGQHDELRTRADTGDEHAATRLARLLARTGDDRLLRFGFDVHGRITDAPTW